MKKYEDKALAYIEENKEKLFGLLSKLIQFDTQNFITHGREKECAEYIEKLYRDLGLETELYSPDSIPGIKEHPGYLPGRGLENRPNVSGIWYGEDKELAVMLAAHIDTMPAGDLDRWDVDPFGGVIKDGKIYGLGAGDNKFGIAGSYYAIKALKECGIKLKKSVVLTSYADEEYGGGDGALAACLKYPCDTYVNLDGGNYEIWIAALGGGCFKISVKKTETTDNAMDVFDAISILMNELKVFAERRRTELHINSLYTGSDMERSAFRLSSFASVGTNHDEAMLSFVIYTDKTKEEIYKELDDILDRVRPQFAKMGIVTEGFIPTTRFFGYYETEKDCLAVKIMKAAAEEAAGKKVRECGSCLTDLSVILPYGSPRSFNFGILRDFALPGGAHQPNEYVDCQEFLNHTKALILFLIRYCGVVEE
ncbi:MAG TPA: M20/M25/M40 family metallo-hydrolase [Clostridiaceae bacterium]|nr:M20/M25/M40 family metallo-hydrolase [Clostridiaceae bacterium]